MSGACTCGWETVYWGPVSTQVLGEPDHYCPEHFPKNHALREEKARSGYEAKVATSVAVNPWMAGSYPPWSQLSEPGKEIWIHWAIAEFWDGGFEDGTAADPVQAVEAPPGPSDFTKIDAF